MQKIFFGIDHLNEALAGSKKVLLVCDSSFPFLSIKESIEGITVPYVMFSDFTPNPLYEQVCKGIDLFSASGCDSVLAVGGGSAIDVAKCIKLAVLAEEGRAAIIPPLVLQKLPIDGTKIPLVAIPTTAGTGSESTHNAVMYFEGAKQTVTNDGILPDYAILEPSVLKTLPLYQKKCTMMDALCQGIESWWSVNSTSESYEYSRKCIELIMANWRSYIFDNDESAAAQIMLAANYGGRAINITATTAAHAFSYKITSLYGLPHGHAVAVCLPEIWQYMIEHMDQCIDSRGPEYLEGIFQNIARAMGVGGVATGIEAGLSGSCVAKAIAIFRQMMTEMDLQSPISKNMSSDIPLLANSVNPIRLKNNPIALPPETIQTLYQKIVKEK